MVDSSREEGKTISIAVIATIAAVALLGVVALTIVSIPSLQQAEAARPAGAGCPATVPGANASQARCFNG
jgi:hypothetical protein